MTVYKVPFPNDSTLVSPCAYNSLQPNISSCPRPGVHVEHILAYLKLLDKEAHIQLVPASFNNIFVDQALKVPDNSSLLGQIYLGLADLTPAFMTLNEMRASLLPHAGVLSRQPLYFIYKTEHSIGPTLNFGHVLSLETVALLAGIVMLWQCLKVILGHLPWPEWLKAFVQKLNYASTLIFCLWYGIFLGCLSSYVVIVFSKPIPPHKPFKNAMGLVEKLRSMEYTAITLYGVVMDQILLPPESSSDIEIYRLFREAAKINPPLKVEEGKPKVMDMLLYSYTKYVFVCDEFSEAMETVTQYCGLDFIIDDYLPPSLFTVFMRQDMQANLTLKPAQLSVFHRQTGRISAKYTPKNDCPEEVKESFRIKINQIFAIFYGILIAYAAGLGILVLEWVVRVWNRFCCTVGKYVLGN